MAQLQHRGGKYNKIVLKHHPIKGLVEKLAAVEAISQVKTIMPGVITTVRGRPIGNRQSGGLQLKAQYIAPDGHIRMIARHANTTQEVRITSSNPEAVLKQLQQLFNT